MSKSLITQNENSKYLEMVDTVCEDIKAIDVNFKVVSALEKIRRAYLIGEALVTSPLFNKGEKGAGKYIGDIAELVSLKKSALYAYAVMYVHYHKVDKSEEKVIGHIYQNYSNLTRALIAAGARSAEDEDSTDVETSFCNQKCKKHCK